jgi:carbon starvation protein
VFHGSGLDLWYHFAIMFEALFILTTLDAGTRVGRYLLQDLLGHVWKPLGQTDHTGATWLASFLCVSAWGWFLIQGVRDPLGGINSLWPLFGIANQLLASIALCLATTVLLKMQIARRAEGKPANLGYAWITLGPLLWLLAVTLTAGLEKIFHPDPKIGFLASARGLAEKLPALRLAMETALPANLAAAKTAWRNAESLRVNFLIDSVVTGAFICMILMVAALSVREWILLLARQKLSRLSETEPSWLPEYALAEARPFNIFNLFFLACLLVRELSGQSAVERTQRAMHCGCQTENQSRHRAYLAASQKRFDGINRCC